MNNTEGNVQQTERKHLGVLNISGECVDLQTGADVKTIGDLKQFIQRNHASRSSSRLVEKTPSSSSKQENIHMLHENN